MNIAEKNRAERMVETWASQARIAVGVATNRSIDSIGEPAIVEAERVKIQKAIQRIKDAGFEFSYGTRYSQQDGISISRSPNHPLVERIRKDDVEDLADIAARATSLITSIWGDAFTFEDLQKALP